MVSEIIRTARLERKWSQQYLADLLGVSRVTVTWWEQGKCGPAKDRIHDVAKLLGLEVTDLLPKAA